MIIEIIDLISTPDVCVWGGGGGGEGDRKESIHPTPPHSEEHP